MNKLNYYIAFLSLIVAISVLDYIPKEEIEFIKILFFFTALGLLLTMIKENFNIKIKSINSIFVIIEDNYLYFITVFITSYIITKIVSFIIEIVDLNIKQNYIYIIFGIVGVLLKMIISKKDTFK